MEKFKVKKKHLTGDIAGFPRRVVQAMVDEQVRQGNPADPRVFARERTANKDGGGFTWIESPMIFFWTEIIQEKKFHLIPKKQSVEPKAIIQKQRIEPHVIIQNMGDFDPRTWTNIPTWRANLEMRFTENLEDFAGLELDEIMEALINHALKKVESENPLATDLAEAFFFEVDWQNIAQVILDKLE